MPCAGTLLWLADAGASSPAWFAAGAGWLDDSERARCARFVREARRRQFVAGRVLLRLALGELLGVAPRAVVLGERPGNAPALVRPERPGAGLSIAHSGEWVACAVSREGPVGVDVERHEPARDLAALAEQAFGAGTAAQLARLDPAARTASFYRMWCRYEAHIKLGCAGDHDYFYDFPGMTLVLSSTQALDARPEIIDLTRLAAIRT